MTRHSRGLALVALVLTTSACFRPCRPIVVVPLSLACSESSVFRGELHFDDAATFESFLETDCLPGFDQTQIDNLVASIDFTTDSVFVSTGPRQQGLRCIESRAADGVEVCDEGLRIGFEDVLVDDDVCTGVWTVAFALPRSEMRAALGL